ncbi:MAG: DUF456 domain-containing protein [Candidatus Eisenbacteria bacterium]
MVDVLQHIGLVVLYVALFALNVSIFLGIPGGWIAFGGILIYDIATGFSTVGWKWLIVMAVVLLVGELIESLLGLVYVAHKGATKWGVLGAFLGGLVGAIVGTFIVPFVGSILFGLIGAFAFAVLFEYIYYRSLDQAVRTGFFAFIGKLGAMFVKLVLSLVNLGLFVYLSWSA